MRSLPLLLLLSRLQVMLSYFLLQRFYFRNRTTCQAAERVSGFQHAVKHADDLITINNAKTLVSELALLVADESRRHGARPMFCYCINDRLRVIHVRHENVEAATGLLDKRNYL